MKKIFLIIFVSMFLQGCVYHNWTEKEKSERRLKIVEYDSLIKKMNLKFEKNCYLKLFNDKKEINDEIHSLFVSISALERNRDFVKKELLDGGYYTAFFYILCSITFVLFVIVIIIKIGKGERI
jgi:hypothetical protein